MLSCGLRCSEMSALRASLPRRDAGARGAGGRRRGQGVRVPGQFYRSSQGQCSTRSKGNRTLANLKGTFNVFVQSLSLIHEMRTPSGKGSPARQVPGLLAPAPPLASPLPLPRRGPSVVSATRAEPSPDLQRPPGSVRPPGRCGLLEEMRGLGSASWLLVSPVETFDSIPRRGFQ